MGQKKDQDIVRAEEDEGEVGVFRVLMGIAELHTTDL